MTSSTKQARARQQGINPKLHPNQSDHANRGGRNEYTMVASPCDNAALDEIVEYLTSIPAWFLATIDETDPTQPRVRPFSFAAAENGKLWFSTSRDKDVYRELAAHPKFELSGWKPGEYWIVVSGEANLDDDRNASAALRQAGFAHMTGIGEHHDSPDDGRLMYFSVKNARAYMRDIDGSERTLAF